MRIITGMKKVIVRDSEIVDLLLAKYQKFVIPA